MRRPVAMRRRMLALALLLTACAPRHQDKQEDQSMIQTQNPELGKYREMLSTMRQTNPDGGLNLPQIKQALLKAKELEQPELVEQALDLLKQTVSQYGSPEARAYYSLNPELNLFDVFSGVGGQHVPAELRQLASPERTVLSLEELRRLPPAQQRQLLEMAQQAEQFYRMQAAGMRSAVNPVAGRADALAMFLRQAEEAIRESEPPTPQAS